ncbi:MAG: T9SS type A sorting domain-containing protein [Gemmatimonadetes bacterium]|jgi:glucose/arabinose dehydrogenase|nr:T9SS type A sorting domain-containing protein [Gemmatimonadota bacterium]MBT6150354.1 T9SS type A sorting domain-containing protein [Gemmatimonadota bacterium]MBT7859554.1 T9SS type A sorting domain-containing protein [Gemmatimonadota bacterium]
MPSPRIRPALSLLALLGICLTLILSTPTTTTAQDDYPPGTFRLTPSVDLGLVSVPVHVPPEFSHVPQDLRLNLPPGFRVSVYAAFESVRRPRFMAFDANGVLHVADMDDDEIVALPDRDGNGVADEAIVVATDFERPHSLQFYNGDLYVGDRPRILKYRDQDGDGLFEEREIFVDDIPSTGSHSTRTLVIDEDAGKMYLGVGWPCDLCRNRDTERGAILQFNLDGSERRVFANGVRNVIGMDIHPVTGQLWGTNNGHDLEGIDAPPEWIDVIRDGGFYGIPFAYGYQVWADFTIPAYRDEILPITALDSARVATMQRPAALVPAHTAPMGIHFYDHGQFPAKYRNAAFVALHAGHAKLAPIEGYSVVALFTEPDGSRSRIADFVTGFQTGVEVEDVWGYPNGLITDDEGALYLSSDLGNRLILKIEHGPLAADWGRHSLPDTLTVGAQLALDALVHIERLAPDAGPPVVTADLSDLGGPSQVALQPAGGDDMRLQFRMAAPPDLRPGLKQIRVHIQQTDAEGSHDIRLEWPVAVLPAHQQEDLVIFDEELAPGWRVANKTWLEDRTYDLQEDLFVFSGAVSASFRTNSGNWDWVLRFTPPEPMDPTRFDRLSFAFHPGPLDWRNGQDLNIYMAGHLIDLIEERLIDPTVKEWQRVEIPLRRFGRAAPIAEITIGGDFSARVYVDDLRLRGASPRTAILDEAETPTAFALAQSYPNPFNSETVIEYAIPAEARVRLRVYNLSGQVVADLVDETHVVGIYQARWDARNRAGQPVASGVYLYRLEAGDHTQSRKLVLVR